MTEVYYELRNVKEHVTQASIRNSDIYICQEFWRKKLLIDPAYTNGKSTGGILRKDVLLLF